jgi:hypothetical protein
MEFLRSQANLGRELEIHIYTHYTVPVGKELCYKARSFLRRNLGIVFHKSLAPAEGGLFYSKFLRRN